MNAGSDVQGFAADTNANDSASASSSGAASYRHRLGTRMITRDGRVWRYCVAGAADLVAGNLIQGPAPIANHLALTSAAQAIGDTTLTVTPGATAGAANLYAEGYLCIDTTPGNGRIYAISGHPAITASTAFTLTLEKDDPIQVALTTSSRYGLYPNLYKNVIQCPTTKTGPVVGFATCVITAAQFGWLCTWGPVPALINGTPAVTAPVVNSATTAGAVDVWTAAAQPTATYVGEMMQVGVSTKNNFVYAKLAP